MSIASYRRNVSRRVTGPRKETCLPAALEQISPHHGYEPEIYQDYTNFINWFFLFNACELDNYVGELKDMVSHLVWPLGGLACEDVLFRHANTAAGFMQHVKSLMRQDYRVVVDIKYGGNRRYDAHSVGLLPVGGEVDYVMLASNHIPKCLGGIVALTTVAEHLMADPACLRDRQNPILGANIMALPPSD